MLRSATVIGSGPNGLSAAIVLARSGVRVNVLEAEETPGGGARTGETTLPGFLHDLGSAVHPMAASSPFFSAMQMEFGWVQPDAPLAHPLDDGTAILLERGIRETGAHLGADSGVWQELMEPYSAQWKEICQDILGPPRLPHHLLLTGRFGLQALRSARGLATARFRGPRARALFAGLAAHSCLTLEHPISAAIGLVMGISAHAVGWPAPKGGAQRITEALMARLAAQRGTVRTGERVNSLNEIGPTDAVLCDLTPRQLLSVAGDRLPGAYKRALRRYRYGPGAFKVDWALSAPVPWRAKECARAGTVHLGGTLEEIAASERAVWNGTVSERPFVLLAQPSLFDATRAPRGKHTLWAYCHVPNGSSEPMLERIEAQIERFAPGFRECVLARNIMPPAALEAINSNLVGGDVNGGLTDMIQFLFRPTWREYGTPLRGLYLCSSSTPPGGGVHGMCGYHAAAMAMRRGKCFRPK